MKTCSCCKKPLQQSDYNAGKQSIFRSTSCKSCHNLSKEKRLELKKQKREEILCRVRLVCGSI